jgi:phosphoglycolate phosphatase
MAMAIRAVENVDYDPVDFHPDIYRSIKARHFDLCADAPKLESESYDIIIHNHVLEHIFCDVTSVVLHLQRALAHDGYHIFSLPFFQDQNYEECLAPLSEQEAIRRFGQKDHCRLFSVNSLDNTFGMYIDRDFRTFIPSKFFEQGELEAINFPRRSWEVVDGSTTIILRKGDTQFTA